MKDCADAQDFKAYVELELQLDKNESDLKKIIEPVDSLKDSNDENQFEDPFWNHREILIVAEKVYLLSVFLNKLFCSSPWLLQWKVWDLTQNAEKYSACSFFVEFLHF